MNEADPLAAIYLLTLALVALTIAAVVVEWGYPWFVRQRARRNVVVRMADWLGEGNTR